MKSSRIILGFLFLAILMAAVPGKALEGKVLVWRYNAHSADLPFPRSKRAEAIWASDVCWSDCGAYCAWGVGRLPQGRRSGSLSEIHRQMRSLLPASVSHAGRAAALDRVSLGVGYSV